MINKVTFTGRETMLTKGIEKGANKVHEYVNAGKIYPKNIVETIEKETAKSKFFGSINNDTYSSPFALTSRANEVSRTQSFADNYSYAVAHGKPAQIAEDTSMHINLIG